MKRTHWRALLHGLSLGRVIHGARRPPEPLNLAHLQGENPWLRHRNIVGICVARKHAGGRFGELCVQVLVKSKQGKRRVPGKYMVPKTIDPRPIINLRRVHTDVREVGELTPDSFVSGARPTRPGFAIGGGASGEGTLGCVVSDGTRLLGLTCAHVLSSDGQLTAGSQVLVPSRAQADDIDVDDPEFGTVAQAGTIGFAAGDAPTNLDAATFVPDNPADLDDEIAFFGRAPSGVAGTVSTGQEVFKVGAATELTHGSVLSTMAVVRVPYSTPNGTRLATFIDQIGITPFTTNGDSGSLVLASDGRAVGLHFASALGMSVCTPIRTVLTRLGVTLP